jgi:hypothetical protein
MIPNTNDTHTDAGDYVCDCESPIESMGVCLRCMHYLPTVNKETHIYVLDYYTMSDGRASAKIEATTPGEAEQKLRLSTHGVDYVWGCYIEPKKLDTAKFCPACRKTRAECDCIPF